VRRPASTISNQRPSPHVGPNFSSGTAAPITRERRGVVRQARAEELRRAEVPERDLDAQLAVEREASDARVAE
jgi:hypothetical protein